MVKPVKREVFLTVPSWNMRSSRNAFVRNLSHEQDDEERAVVRVFVHKPGEGLR